MPATTSGPTPRFVLGSTPSPSTCVISVVELHWFSGLGFAEIGALLGATPVAVRIRAHRGYRRLRQVLG